MDEDRYAGVGGGLPPVWDDLGLGGRGVGSAGPVRPVLVGRFDMTVSCIEDLYYRSPQGMETLTKIDAEMADMVDRPDDDLHGSENIFPPRDAVKKSGG